MVRKIAVITGASRGIGRAAALLFAEKGYDLALSCISRAGLLEEVQSQVMNAGADCLICTADMGNPGDVKAFFTRIREYYGSVDVLVNNAGISVTGLFQEMTQQEWERILSSNLSSVFYCSQEAVRIMLRQGRGSIVNVSSVWGNTGASCEVAYSATKSGVNGLTRALARELAPSGIRVNAAAFGLINTDMNSSLTSEDVARLKDEIGMGRMGEPEEAAQLIWQLAEAPEYMTGQIVTMDGAWT